jgi:hypothetical protein
MKDKKLLYLYKVPSKPLIKKQVNKKFASVHFTRLGFLWPKFHR